MPPPHSIFLCRVKKVLVNVDWAVSSSILVVFKHTAFHIYEWEISSSQVSFTLNFLCSFRKSACSPWHYFLDQASLLVCRWQTSSIRSVKYLGIRFIDVFQHFLNYCPSTCKNFTLDNYFLSRKKFFLLHLQMRNFFSSHGKLIKKKACVGWNGAYCFKKINTIFHCLASFFN